MNAGQLRPGHPGPRVLWPATLLGGAGAGWWLARGERPLWRYRGHPRRQVDADAVHHRLLPLLHASERALDAGDVELGLLHLRSAGLVARTELRSATGERDPVVTAVRRARQVWEDRLSLATVAVEPLPPRLHPTTRRALHDLTLEGLHNIARHQPGATAHLALRVRPDRILLTVTARGGPEGRRQAHHPAAATAASEPGVTAQADPPTGGYGLDALRRTVHDAGGQLRLHVLATGSVLEADLPRRRGLRRRR